MEKKKIKKPYRYLHNSVLFFKCISFCQQSTTTNDTKIKLKYDLRLWSSTSLFWIEFWSCCCFGLSDWLWKKKINIGAKKISSKMHEKIAQYNDKLAYEYRLQGNQFYLFILKMKKKKHIGIFLFVLCVCVFLLLAMKSTTIFVGQIWFIFFAIFNKFNRDISTIKTAVWKLIFHALMDYYRILIRSFIYMSDYVLQGGKHVEPCSHGVKLLNNDHIFITHDFYQLWNKILFFFHKIYNLDAHLIKRTK